jgi:hypothetical protein
MAILSRSQQKELILKPRNGAELNKALKKRVRTNLHAETETDCDNLDAGHTRFLDWVSDILRNDENLARFKSLYRPPVPTNELVASIFTEFEKIFEAQNSFEKFDFSAPEFEQDFTDYRKRLGDYSYWATQGFEAFKTGIDNILVVDLPGREQAKQIDGKPSPYYYILDLARVIDIENTKVKGRDANGRDFYYFKAEYLIFRETDADGRENIFCFDDEKFTRFIKTEGGELIWVEDVLHDLGYCPARSFWTTPLNSKTTIQKSGPITGSVSDLDWLLFFQISERYLQLYAPFPIYAVYEPKCNYRELDGMKRRCIDGFLEIEGQRAIGHNKTKCPQCSAAVKVGPGNVLKIKVPKDRTSDFDLMANPMKVIPAEVTSLDYVRKTINEYKSEIFTKCVGRSQDQDGAQAKNELQVNSSFESSEAKLLNVKRNFEIIKLFTLETVARLRYGSDYLGGVVNFGDKFYNKSESKELAEYEQAVKNGLPAYELALRREDIYEARYRNNPKMKERLKILRNLEPYPDLTVDKIQDLRRNLPELVSLSDIVIKLNFNGFIDRFEREQANLNTYASEIDFSRKIDLIREELVKYAAEHLAGIQPPAAPPAAPPGVPAPAAA